jgi:uncharacterized protein YbcV (DUF1398 family)
MFDKERINEIATVSKEERWEYPRIFNALKDAGVEYYETSVRDHTIVYSGGGDQLNEDPGGDSVELSVAEAFNSDEVKAAIARNQNKETDYVQFLREIAAAGVQAYRVDMTERTVTYKGGNGQVHVERVPDF